MTPAEHRHHGIRDLRSATLRDFLRVARRRKWMIVSAIVLVPTAALFFSFRQETMYQASAEVLLSQQNLASALTNTVSPSQFQQADRAAQTQADLARVPEVARRTLASAGLSRSPDNLLAHSSVSTETNSDLLQFSVTDHNPALARRLATAYARTYTRYREALDTAPLRKARAEVGRRIQGLESAGDRKSPLYQSLVEKDQELATMEALQIANASLVKPADGASQVQPKPVRNGVLGLALGVVLGLGLALLWEALDTRVRNAEEIGELLGTPLLARLPEPGRQLRRKDRLVMLAEPRGMASEPFRMLRTNLDFVRLGQDVRTIMVTSAVEQEGKSTTAANLAVALARAGQHVCLVDLDLRQPYLDRFFNLRHRTGLTQVAIGQASLADVLVSVPLGSVGEGARREERSDNGHVAVPGLPVLPSLHGGGLCVVVAGLVPPNVGEFAGSEVLGSLLGELRARFDTVLIDVPPALQVGDAMALSRNVDGIAVITRLNVVRRPMLNELKRLLETSPARTLGFVLTSAESEEGYGYGGGYYGSYASERPEKVTT